MELKKPVFVDLFAGCGGLSLGLLQAGWKGCFAIERTDDAFMTYRHNLVDSGRYAYDWPAWLPKQAHDIEAFLSHYKDKLSELSGEVDLIAGGPPCQGFSPAGKRNPRDPRNRMAERYIEVVKILKPKFLLLENVRGFDTPFQKATKTKKAVPYSHVVKCRLEKEGYNVSFKVLVSADWGVPQKRPRFILVATRKNLRFKWDPFETLLADRTQFLEARGLKTEGHNTTADAIDDLRIEGKPLVESVDGNVKGFFQIEYQAPEKPSAFLNYVRKDVSSCYAPNSLRLPKHRAHIVERFRTILAECPKGRALTQEQREKYGLKKHSITPLCPDKPSATMTTLPDDYLHYSEPRILTVREMARIQSFPDWFEFLGQYTTGGPYRKKSCPRYTQVGNAVPPLLGEALGELVLRAIRSQDSSQTKAA